MAVVQCSIPVVNSARPGQLLVPLRRVLTETRGTDEMPPLHNVKVRIDKEFPFGRLGQRLGLSLDVRTLFNVDTPNNILNNSSPADYYTGVGHVGILNVVPPRSGAGRHPVRVLIDTS